MAQAGPCFPVCTTLNLLFIILIFSTYSFSWPFVLDQVILVLRNPTPNVQWRIILPMGSIPDMYFLQFSSVAQSCPTLYNPMNRSTPGLPVHHQLPEFTQTYVHQVCDAIQPSHPLTSPFPPAPNPSQHRGLFQWVNSLHEVAKVLEFQLQHQSFQWTPRTGLL